MSNETNKKNEDEINPRRLKLKELSLSEYTINPLVKRNINTLGDVTKYKKSFFENMSNLRKKSLEELEDTLKKYGLDFKEDLFLRAIEELDLSENTYKSLKEREIDTIGDIIHIKIKTFTELSKKEATEILVRMENIGITKSEMSHLLGEFDDTKYMLIRMKHYPVYDNMEYMEELLPLVADRFMLYSNSCKTANCRKLYLTTINREIEYKQDIYIETRKIVKYFDNYLKEFEKIIRKEYKLCVCDYSAKECKSMIEAIKKHFHEMLEVLEEKKKLFYEITTKMENCTQLQLSDINKLKLYFPLVIESEVCRTLLPYTKDNYYIKNEERYEIVYDKRTKTQMKIDLKYVAKNMKKSTFNERIKPTRRNNYSGRSYSLDSDSTYGADSFSEKLGAEIAGTAMFIRGFLPF